MRAIYKAPGKPPELIDVENTLEALQAKVGGWIEAVPVTEDCCIICNEEGRLLGMEPNLTFCGAELVGPVLWVGADGEEFCDVPEPDYLLRELEGRRGHGG